MTERQRNYFENRIRKLAKMGENGCFQMFVGDFRKAMKFYRNAVTSLDRKINGENEKKDSSRYARLLLASNYLDGQEILSDNYTGMQKLRLMSELEPLVESLAA